MKRSPENASSFLSRKTFWWFNSMCALGRRKPLEIEDLYSLNPEETCATLVPQWEFLWNRSIRGLFSPPWVRFVGLVAQLFSVKFFLLQIITIQNLKLNKEKAILLTPRRIPMLWLRLTIRCRWLMVGLVTRSYLF